MLKIFIGYDPHEAVNYHVCSNSIIKNSSNIISIIPLSLKHLPFYNEVHTDSSTEFTYLRFLVPYICDFKGQAVYLDGDMIVQTDITKLILEHNSNCAVSVVKHEYLSKLQLKKSNKLNLNYPRKNWSSVIIWNCEHIKNKILTPNFIETSTGEYLHRFSWLNDNEIFEISKEWNWLVGEYIPNYNAKILHYTLGTKQDTAERHIWLKEKSETTYLRNYND